MSEPINFDFGDLNLDFLELSPPQPTQGAPQIVKCVLPTPDITSSQPYQSSKINQITAEQSGDMPRRKYRIEELAKQIANVDLYSRQIKSFQKEHKESQKQLYQLQSSADDIRKLYVQEKEERTRLQSLANELSIKCESLKKELANKTFLCDQMDSHLKDINSCPIPYKDLALGYLQLLCKYEEHTKLPLPTTTNLLADNLRTYCKEKSMLVPEAAKRSPKKRAPKVVKKHSYVQCEIWKNAPTSICIAPASKPKQLRSQGTQYFSTTTTRSTCTSAIIMKRTVGTCFPEQPVLPPFNEIVQELSQWDIQPLSPLCDVEPLMSKTVNTGTCTTICNIQRTVDYIGSGYHPLTSIKQSSSRPPSRSMLESVKHEMITPPPLSPPVHFSHLGTMESSTASFDDLWHIFGHMLFSILRNRQGERFNTATRNVGNAPCTQQEFNQWLTSIYGNASEQPEQKISRGKTAEQKTSGKEDNHVDYKNIVNNGLRLLNPCTASENSLRNTEHRQKNTDVPQQNHGAFSPARSFCSSEASFSSKDLPSLSLDQKENGKLRLSSECLSKVSRFHIPKPINEAKNFNGLKSRKPKSHHSANVADEILKLFPKLENSEVIRTKINKLVCKKKSKGKHKKLKQFKECITSEAQHTENLSGKLDPSAESADETKKHFNVEEDEQNENELNVTTSKFEGNLEEPLNIVANDETQLPSPGELELAQESLRNFSPMPNKEEGNLEEVENNKNVLNSYQFYSTSKVEVGEVKKVENLLKTETKPTLSVPSIDVCETAVEFIMELPSFSDDSDKYKNSITADEYKIAEWSTLYSNQKQCNNHLEWFDVRKPKVRNIDNKKKPPKDLNKLMFDLFGSETEDSDDDENNLKPLQNHLNSNELQSALQQTKSTPELLQYHAFHKNVLHKNSIDTSESYQKNEPINGISFQHPEENKLPQFKFIKSVKDKKPVKQLTHINSLLDSSFPENEPSSHIPVLQQPVNESQSLQYYLCHQNMSSSNSSAICIENMDERNSTPPKELPQEATTENELCQGQSLIFQEWVKEEQPTNILYEIPLEEKTSTELCQEFWDKNVTPEKIGELEPYSSSSLSHGETTTYCESAEQIKYKETTIAVDENNTQYIKNDITQIPMTFFNSYQLEDSQKSNGTFKKPQQIELPNINKGVVYGCEEENENLNELNLVIDETDSNSVESGETSNSFLRVASVGKNAVDEKREEAEKSIKLQTTPDPKLNRTDIGTSLNTFIFIPKKESSENISNASPVNEIIQPEDKLIDDKHNRFHNYLYHMLQDVGPRSISPISNISSLSPTSSVKNQPKKRGRKRKSEMSQPATKLPPTANIACKRSERLRIKRIARTMTESYTMPTLPSIALGKYTTKRVYDTNNSTFEVKEDVAISHQAVDDEDSMQINLGFFTEIDAGEFGKKEIQETGNEKESEKIIKAECETKVEEISSLSTAFQENFQYKSIVETKKCIVYPQTQPQLLKSKEDNQSATEANESEAINNNNKSHCNIIPEDERLSSSSSPLPCTQYDLLASLPLSQQYDSSAASPPETKIYPSEVKHNPAKVSLECATHNNLPASLPLSQQYDSSAAYPSETKIDPSEFNHNPAKVSVKSATQNDTTENGTKNLGLLEHLIANYKNELYKLVTDSFSKKTPAKTKLLSKLCKILKAFLVNTTESTDQLESSVLPLVTELHVTAQNLSVITEAIIVVIQQAPRPEVELKCLLADVPQKYLGTQHRRLSFVIQRFQMLHPQFFVDLLGQLENKLFNFDINEKLSLSAILNITQLYLLIITIQLPQLKVNPARLFVAKCLYYYKVRAIPMIYEVLCCFPTTLPHREEREYDRSDALITVIQHILMTTKYDMNSKDLFTKQLLSKLRFEYHFEPFKPERSEVLTNLVDKLKAGKLENVPYAMALLCKRLPQPKVEADVLQAQLLPLVYEYYRGITGSDAHDDTIAGLLECISMVIKPFRLDTDIDLYLSIFTRFLNVTDRPRIQEAAVQAILRCQRFGYVNCFNALVDFKPFFDLKVQTKAMLQTFIYRRSAKFLRHLLKMSAF